jgi:hypothetical protein
MSTEDEISDVLTNLAKPKTDATLTLRIIKSFEFRTEKSLVLHGVNLDTTTVGDLKAKAKQGVNTALLGLAQQFWQVRAHRSCADAARMEALP